MHLFIDTNVFLSFYHLTSDDLEELRKLAVLIEQKRVVLLLPQQVVDEFRRNRETKIADAIKGLKEQRLNLQFPQICKDYPEYAELRTLQKQYEERHAALLDKLTHDISDGTLKADETIKELFAKAERIENTPEIVVRARLRVDIGNPPGKELSLGDAINWETLLERMPILTDLHFISDDQDYSI
jgi:predicted nucleic acid-binding protein